MAQEILKLSDATADFNQFVAQIETALSKKSVWVGNLTTQSSQTIIELISAIGTFNQAKIQRVYENAFAETAQSDSAILANTQMQGIRMSRKLPAGVVMTLTSPVDVTIPPLTQLLVSGNYYFAREQIVLDANVPNTGLTAYQGKIKTVVQNGIGTDSQTFISAEDDFQVSDQDVVVRINNTIIPKAFGDLWNFRNLPGYSDLTTADGRLLIVFGSTIFGSVPKVTDEVSISYPLTTGETGNNTVLLGKTVTVDGFPLISGVVTANPTGGGDDKPLLAYKNLSSGAFGTYQSAVTGSQYKSLVGIYPGIVDAYTQAQREINPMKAQWMNTIRVSGLTNSPWTQQQKKDFCDHMQKVTMYSPYFIWQDAIPVPRDIELELYCFNTAVLTQVEADVEAIVTRLLSPRQGLLMTDFYEYDLMNVARAAGNGMISYVVVKNPTYPMIVTAPVSPPLEYEIINGTGSLGEYQYAYGMSTVNTSGEEGPPTNWVHPQIISTTNSQSIRLTWDPVGDTAFYKLWGRKPGELGLLATIPATDPLVFTDDGSITPSGNPPNTLSEVPIRYNSIRSLKVTAFYAQRQQRVDNLPTRNDTNA